VRVCVGVAPYGDEPFTPDGKRFGPRASGVASPDARVADNEVSFLRVGNRREEERECKNEQLLGACHAEDLHQFARARKTSVKPGGDSAGLICFPAHTTIA